MKTEIFENLKTTFKSNLKLIENKQKTQCLFLEKINNNIPK